MCLVEWVSARRSIPQETIAAFAGRLRAVALTEMIACHFVTTCGDSPPTSIPSIGLSPGNLGAGGFLP
jgi:hypothetical protein